MSENGDEEARIRELLLEVERIGDVPDYPDFRRGVCWGLLAGIPVLAIQLVIFCCTGSWEKFWPRMRDYGWMMFVIAAGVFLVGWGIGSFRPQKF